MRLTDLQGTACRSGCFSVRCFGVASCTNGIDGRRERKSPCQAARASLMHAPVFHNVASSILLAQVRHIVEQGTRFRGQQVFRQFILHQRHLTQDQRGLDNQWSPADERAEPANAMPVAVTGRLLFILFSSCPALGHQYPEPSARRPCRTRFPDHLRDHFVTAGWLFATTAKSTWLSGVSPRSPCVSGTRTIRYHRAGRAGQSGRAAPETADTAPVSGH